MGVEKRLAVRLIAAVKGLQVGVQDGLQSLVA